jgi:hypothetical protein
MIKFILTIMISALISTASLAQDYTQALAAADSTNFSVCKKNGWLLYNSYLSVLTTDQMQIELIIGHERDIDLSQEQLIGKVKTASFVPDTEQTLIFKLLEDSYQLRITTTGECYLRLASGSLPGETGPIIISVRTAYNK